MPEALETIKVFVRKDNNVTITCPSCNKLKNASVASYKDSNHFLKVRCNCGKVFRVHLDFRQFYRKTTELPGTYTCIQPPGGGGGTMTVTDISLGGMGIHIPGTHNLKVEYILNLVFDLDDKKSTHLVKEVTIRSIKDGVVGCRFSDSQLYEKELGFYLQS